MKKKNNSIYIVIPILLTMLLGCFWFVAFTIHQAIVTESIVTLFDIISLLFGVLIEVTFILAMYVVGFKLKIK